MSLAGYGPWGHKRVRHDLAKKYKDAFQDSGKDLLHSHVNKRERPGGARQSPRRDVEVSLLSSSGVVARSPV